MKLNENGKINDMLNKVVGLINDFSTSQSEQIDRLKAIGVSLSAEKDIDKVFDMILQEALSYTDADGATIYSVSEDKKILDFEIVYNKSMNLHMGTIDNKVTWPGLKLLNEDSSPNKNTMATYIYHSGEFLNFEDVYHQELFDTSGTKEVDLRNGYRTKSVMAVPMKDHEDEVLGVIQLINAKNENGEVVSFTKQHLAMVRSLASQAAITLTNKNLIKSLEQLLYDFARSIASAIDRKSKYTAGHISRVAKLSEEIALHLNENHEIFPKVKFSKDELEEISFAAWMHDVGKIITPEYIMDKSTKLEMITDRIEIIEMRVNLILKAIEIDRLKNPSCSGEFDNLKYNLINDLNFLKKTNIGSEFMRDEDLERIHTIANFEYQHGVEHLRILSEEERDFLCIRKGTLSDMERAKMSEHVSTTLEMLNKLTFPKKLKNVPIYAGAHHEKLNGKGYPQKLKGDEIPLQGRIIAIADVFEALTAPDRPYKKGKTLSEALKILAFMVKDKEIDSDLLDLLLDTGLYLDFANKYVDKHQINNVDLKEIKKIYKGI